MQQVQWLAAPGAERRREARGQRFGAEHAAVEQERIGHRQRRFHGFAGFAGFRQGQRLPRLRRVLREKRRDVPGDRGIARIRQPEFDDAAARAPRPLVRRDRRKEPVDDDLLDFLSRDLRRTRPADELRPRAEQRDRRGFGRVGAEQLLLGGAAALDELRDLPGREPRVRRLPDDPSFDEMREREVHVVAAEHQVVAHADARQERLAILHLHFDQREVGRAAADVADEHEAGRAKLVVERFAMVEQPVVERGLRFFEQAQRRQLRHPGRFERQRARAFVERCGHRQHDVLLFERRVGEALVPRRAHVREIACARRDRRDLRDIVARAPGQDRRDPIHRAVRQPALRARDEPARHLRAERAGEPADHDRLLCVEIGVRPGQLQIARVEFARRRVIAQRRQQRPRRDFARAHELLDVEDADLHGPRLDIRDDRVARAQIDADRIALHRRSMRHSTCSRTAIHPRRRARRTRPSSARCCRAGRLRVRACRPR